MAKNKALIDAKKIEASSSSISIYDNLPFAVNRIFLIEGASGVIRGGHAHKKCRQILLCLSGKVDLRINDGKNQYKIQLDEKGEMYVHDVLHWLDMDFIEASKLLVLAEFPYDESEYIRDYHMFEAEFKQ